MAKARTRKVDTQVEPENTIEAIAWWKKRILAAWRRGETPIVRKRMAAILALSQATVEWTAKRKTTEQPEVNFHG